MSFSHRVRFVSTASPTPTFMGESYSFLSSLKSGALLVLCDSGDRFSPLAVSHWLHKEEVRMWV